jgi:hypothetical protein
MRELNRPFEQVNVEQFVINMYQIVNPIDDATPPSASPLPACTVFFVDPLDPTDHALSVQWSVNGVAVPGATGLTFTPDVSMLGPMIHTVSVRVVDTTTRVRDETLRNLFMTETRSWTINPPPPYGDVNQSGVVDLDDVLCLLAGFGNFALCPNADISPCGGSGGIGLDDILAVLAAFSGNPGCPPSC